MGRLANLGLAALLTASAVAGRESRTHVAPIITYTQHAGQKPLPEAKSNFILVAHGEPGKRTVDIFEYKSIKPKDEYGLVDACGRQYSDIIADGLVNAAIKFNSEHPGENTLAKLFMTHPEIAENYRGKSPTELIIAPFRFYGITDMGSPNNMGCDEQYSLSDRVGSLFSRDPGMHWGAIEASIGSLASKYQ